MSSIDRFNLLGVAEERVPYFKDVDRTRENSFDKEIDHSLFYALYDI